MSRWHNYAWCLTDPRHVVIWPLQTLIKGFILHEGLLMAFSTLDDFSCFFFCFEGMYLAFSLCLFCFLRFLGFDV